MLNSLPLWQFFLLTLYFLCYLRSKIFDLLFFECLCRLFGLKLRQTFLCTIFHLGNSNNRILFLDYNLCFFYL